MSDIDLLLNAVDDLRSQLMGQIQGQTIYRTGHESIQRKFTMTEVVDIVRRSYTSLEKYEREGKIPKAELRNGRRIGFSIDQLHQIHKAIGSAKRRPQNTKPMILGIGGFRNGIGKSTMAVHLSHYLAIRGARVLLIDADFHASATRMFGLDPLYGNVKLEQTIAPFLSQSHGEISLDYAIQPTAWPSIDIVPSETGLQVLEHRMASHNGADREFGQRLQQILGSMRSAAENYDLVIIDLPPGFGAISNLLTRAATALLIPCRPTLRDFESTTAYINALSNLQNECSPGVDSSDYDFVRIVASRVDVSRETHRLAVSFMQQAIGSLMLSSIVYEDPHLWCDHSNIQSIYEVANSAEFRRSYKKLIGSIDRFCNEVESLIDGAWTRLT